jgi:hypothetical protein
MSGCRLNSHRKCGAQVKYIQVKNGMEHNVGRRFEKCAVQSCIFQLPATDVGLWRWRDGSLPCLDHRRKDLNEIMVCMAMMEAVHSCDTKPASLMHVARSRTT